MLGAGGEEGGDLSEQVLGKVGTCRRGGGQNLFAAF